MPDSLLHDAAWSAATCLVEVFVPDLPEEKQRELFALAYKIVKAAIESYQVMDTRRQQRLKPCKN